VKTSSYFRPGWYRLNVWAPLQKWSLLITRFRLVQGFPTLAAHQNHIWSSKNFPMPRQHPGELHQHFWGWTRHQHFQKSLVEASAQLGREPWDGCICACIQTEIMDHGVNHEVDTESSVLALPSLSSPITPLKQDASHL
jgi:hypothetical protein